MRKTKKKKISLILTGVLLTLYRGPAGEWYDVVCMLLRQSKVVREWFAKFVLFCNPDRFSEYLLECPSGEVRTLLCRKCIQFCTLTYPPTYSTVQKNANELPQLDYGPCVKSPKYQVKKHDFSAEI